ncbi:MAG TPA: hypothetical protein VGZ47_01115 [Gemmataceae bacterium]|jgi:uncharacterized membrane protein YphA (DoxX/SURF4 family)|nr:hypothetical protein [Gemmataceae bacterium]
MRGNERLALILIILLRIAIGWHFLTEAYEKYRSVYSPGPTETIKAWSSEVYFREGTGPMAKFVRGYIGETDDELLARVAVKSVPLGTEESSYPPYQRMPDALDKEWDDYFGRFAAFYDLTPEQREAAQKRLQEDKSQTVLWFVTKPKSIDWFLAGLWTEFDQKPLKRTIQTANGSVNVEKSPADLADEFRSKLQEYRDAQGPKLSHFDKDVYKAHRAALRGEIATLRSELQEAVDGRTKEMQKDLEGVLSKEQRAKGQIPQAQPKKPIFFLFADSQAERPRLIQLIDNATIFGLLAIGICLLFGLFSRTASFCGAMFLLMTILTWPSLPWLPAPPVSEGNYLFVNKNMIEMLALLFLTCVPSGRWFGLDGVIHTIFRKKEKPLAA